MIYSVDLHNDFVDSLCDFILNHAKSEPFKMAQTEIILPTKRSCLMVRQAFLKKSDSQTFLLPKMTALYEMDNLDVQLPPVMTKLQRTLLLSRLCAAKPNVSGMDKAVMIAVGLGELLDEFYQYETDISKLHTLVPDFQFAEHWNETITFLDIIHTQWPKILSEYNQIDEMDYQIRMIKSYADKWLKNPPSHPVIMAGFDGAIPAVIELAKTVHSLPNGTLFLYGLDKYYTNKEFTELPPIHPQAPLKRLLDALPITPDQVTTKDVQANSVEQLIHEALKPADKTDSWRHINGLSSEALTHIKRFDCNTPDEEATMIALLLRQVLETPKKTAAVVTTDRSLARRICIEMKRWNVQLDDSAGTPINQTQLGIYLSLICQVALNPQDGCALLGLLKHPLSADTINPTQLRFEIKQAEKDARLHNKPLEYKTHTDFSYLFDAFCPNRLTSFSHLLATHLKVAESLATSHDKSGFERIWQDDAGQTVFSFFTDLMKFADLLGDIEPAYYPTILNLLMGSLSVRPKYGMHPRLDILGPIEARFHQADTIIIAGLNEGSFPQLPDTGPWLNRPMREALGLPPLENKIAVSAMDFASAFCKQEVYLTRCLKSDGTPTIPSRFISRLETVLTAANISWPVYAPDLARLLDKPHKIDPIVRPAPKPPVSARPTGLSVSTIELWMKNPYAIYARYILQLKPLNSLEKPKKQQLFGTAVHKALETYIKTYPHGGDETDLINMGISYLTQAGFNDGEKAFYIPKLKKIASWFVQQQSERSGNVTASFPEENGSTTFTVDGGKTFTLSGTADRIDIVKDGSVEIIDYKTGSVPSLKEVGSGFAPQLPLEGYLVTQNAFQNAQNTTVSDLQYWKLSGKNSGSKIIPIMKKKKNHDTDIINRTYQGLKRLVTVFYQEDTPYECCPAPEKAPRYNDYEHLSRSKEWLIADDNEDENDN